MVMVNDMKKITILWIILIIILLTSLSIIGINASKRQAPYKALENDSGSYENILWSRHQFNKTS